MNEIDYHVVIALLQQLQEENLRLRKQLFAHDLSVLQESMDDMLKTLHATQVLLAYVLKKEYLQRTLMILEKSFDTI